MKVIQTLLTWCRDSWRRRVRWRRSIRAGWAMSLGNDPGSTGASKRKSEVFMAQADAARAARLAGRGSLLRRWRDRRAARRARRAEDLLAVREFRGDQWKHTGAGGSP